MNKNKEKKSVTISDSNTRVMVIMSKELKAQLEKEAKEQHRSLSNYIVTVLEGRNNK